MPHATNELLTPKQVADELQLSLDTIYRYISKKKFQVIRLSVRDVRIRRSELERFLRERETDKGTD